MPFVDAETMTFSRPQVGGAWPQLQIYTTLQAEAFEECGPNFCHS